MTINVLEIQELIVYLREYPIGDVLYIERKIADTLNINSRGFLHDTDLVIAMCESILNKVEITIKYSSIVDPYCRIDTSIDTNVISKSGTFRNYSIGLFVLLLETIIEIELSDDLFSL